MKLEQLSMFVTVAQVGSLSEASALLHKTQPAISQGIKQLENTLNFALFSRNGYRLELTSAGKTMFHKAMKLLDDAAQLKQVAHHIAQGNEVSITIAIEASFNLKGILPLLKNMQNQFPETQIIIRQEYITGAIEALLDGGADLCITPTMEFSAQEEKIEKHLLNSGSLINVASPLLLKRNPNLRQATDLLNEYQIIVQDSGTGSKNIEWGVQQGQRRWYVNDFPTKKMLIESAMGWGKLPGYLADEGIANNTLKMLSLSDVQNITPLKYYIIKKRGEVLGPVGEAVWKQFKNYQI
jgi:DNA-binding transcriptional LysR family regulator